MRTLKTTLAKHLDIVRTFINFQIIIFINHKFEKNFCQFKMLISFWIYLVLTSTWAFNEISEPHLQLNNQNRLDSLNFYSLTFLIETFTQ